MVGKINGSLKMKTKTKIKQNKKSEQPAYTKST